MKLPVNLLISYFIVFLLGGVGSYLFLDDGEIVEKQATAYIKSNNPVIVESEPDKSRLNSLQRIIDEFKDQLASLEEENNSLLESLRLSNSKLTSVLDKDLITKKINTMSEDDLRSKLKSVVRDEHLEGIEDAKAFAHRLAEVVAEDEIDTDIDENQTVNTDVKVSVSRDYYYIDAINPDLVASKSRRLYANIYSTQPLGDAFVKWKNITTDELISIRSLNIGNAENRQYVWTIPKGGWTTGVYSVTLYSIDESLKPLAINRFTITNVVDEGPEPPYDTSDGSMKSKAN